MKRYRLYIDESGDHTYKQISKTSQRYLGLIGCFVETETYRAEFHPALDQLKQTHFPRNPDDPIVLHRTDIINRRGAFWKLRDQTVRQCFNKDLLQFLTEQEYILVAVVIDKKSHVDRYRDIAFHPYHYCLTLLLERYCGFLNRFNAEGDVLAESRRGKEDFQLKAAYQRIYENGTLYRDAEFFRGVLTSKELKLKSKTANIAGLQVADILAHPCKEDILLDEQRICDPGPVFGKEVCRAVESKYNRRYSDGCIDGYGKVFLG